jgi:hypothetical protein
LCGAVHPEPKRVLEYAASSWVHHLLEIDSTVDSFRLAIVDIYHLLTSNGICAWIMFGLRNTHLLSSLSANDEEPLLQSICNWYSARKLVNIEIRL